MNEKKRKKKDDPASNLDKIRENLEESADTLRESFRGLDAVKKNRRAITDKLRAIENNVENVKRLLRALRRKSAGPAEEIKKVSPVPKPKSPKEKRKQGAQFLSEQEYRKLYPKKKAVVFFHNSDFMTLDEYIDYMQRKPISKEEAQAADWDAFLVNLTIWAATK